MKPQTLLMILILSSASWGRPNEINVSAGHLWIREQPSIQSPIIGIGTSGQRYRIDAFNGNWVAIRLTTWQRTGWVELPEGRTRISAQIPKERRQSYKQSKWIPRLDWLWVMGIGLLILGFSFITLKGKLLSLSSSSSQASADLLRLLRIPTFPSNPDEASLFAVLIKQSAILEGGGKIEEKNEFVIYQCLCQGLMSVLSDLHRYLIEDLHRDPQDSLRMLLEVGEEILQEFS